MSNMDFIYQGAEVARIAASGGRGLWFAQGLEVSKIQLNYRLQHGSSKSGEADDDFMFNTTKARPWRGRRYVENITKLGDAKVTC